MGKIIGIDLGTTNSAVAVVEGGQPKIIHSTEGENIIPSVVDPAKRIAGRVEKRQQIVNPKQNTTRKAIWGRRLPKRLLLFQHISMIHSVRQQSKLEK